MTAYSKLRVVSHGKPGRGAALCQHCKALCYNHELHKVTRAGCYRGVWWCGPCVDWLTGGSTDDRHRTDRDT